MQTLRSHGSYKPGPKRLNLIKPLKMEKKNRPIE